jgi:hypothetical protein
MMKQIFRTCFFATCFALIATAVQAQVIVHALSGTIKSSNAKIGMTEIATDDGSSSHFRWMLFAEAEAAVNFDKTISANSVTPDKVTATGRHVIVYYYGQDTVRILVGLRDLGDGPIENHAGTFVKMGHDHLLTIQNSSGTEESFHVDPKTVADTATGVSIGFKFELSKGETVRVTAAPATGTATALLIAAGI